MIGFRSFAVAAAMMFTTAAQAQQYRGVAFSGVSVSDGFSAYAGAVSSLPGASLGNGLGLRASVNGGRFHYLAGGTEIEANYVGAEAALVYQTSGEWGWSNLSVGPRVTNIELSPDDLTNNRRGTRFDLAFQADGGANLSPEWRLGWFGSVGAFDEAYQARLQLGRLVDAASQTRLGIEGGLQGDPSYSSVSAGIFAATRLGQDLEGQLSGGFSDQEGRAARPYVAIGLSKLF